MDGRERPWSEDNCRFFDIHVKAGTPNIVLVADEFSVAKQPISIALLPTAQ
jgi:hypothetical protein